LIKRILVPFALLVLAALAVTACGGGGSSDESKITESIETAATTSDPSNCTELQTQRFDEQNASTEGKAAIKKCEEEAEGGENEAESVTVSNISVEGETGTAEVEFEGGSLNSQTLEIAVAEEEGTWKVDQIEGFVTYDGEALAEAFERKFEKEPGELSEEQISCIAEGIAEASKAEAEELFFSGTTEAVTELAEYCS